MLTFQREQTSCIFLKDYIDFGFVDLDDKFYIEKCFEYCYIHVEGFNIGILALYRSPSGSLDAFLNTLEGILTHLGRNKQLALAGDFNVRLGTAAVATSKLQDILNSFNLEQTTNQPTRGLNCLDNIFLDSKLELKSANVCELGFSDHRGQLISFLNVNIPEHQTETKVACRPITQAGLTLFYDIVCKKNWNFVNNLNISVNEKFNIFINSMEEAYLQAFPERYIRIRAPHLQSKWFNRDLKNLRDHLIFLRELHNQYKLPNFKSIYKEFRGRYKSEIRKAKIRANDSKFYKSEPSNVEHHK